MRPDEERTWAILAHAGALLSALVALAFLGPLVVLLVFGNRSRYVRHHATESLNFQLTALLLGVAAILLIVVTIGVGALLVIPLGAAYVVFWFVVVVIGAVRAGNGDWWRYPLTLRLVK
jgi:uncharacterized Tic20 family protein